MNNSNSIYDIVVEWIFRLYRQLLLVGFTFASYSVREQNFLEGATLASPFKKIATYNLESDR